MLVLPIVTSSRVSRSLSINTLATSEGAEESASMRKEMYANLRYAQDASSAGTAV